MISVGWRLTNVARSEANSEYLRLTSRPCHRISLSFCFQLGAFYAAIDGVLYEVDIVLPCLGDEDGLSWVLVQPLLHTRIVAALFGCNRLAALLVLVVVDIAHVPLRDILGRLLRGGRCLGRRRRRSVGYCDMVSSEPFLNFAAHLEPYRQ